jgi:alpha-L-rhamnosidase
MALIASGISRGSHEDGSTTECSSLTTEVALLHRTDWSTSAKLTSGPPQGPEPKRPFLLRRTFTKPASLSAQARLYATAHGVYEVEINGKRVRDQIMAPGWPSYHHHLHYQTYDITSLLEEGDNVIGVHVAEGWFAGRLGRPGVQNHWGERPAFLGQLEVGEQVVGVSDASWEYLYSPILLSEMYNGETYDSTAYDTTWSTTSPRTRALGSAEEVGFPDAELIAPELPPIRRVMELKPKRLLRPHPGRRFLTLVRTLWAGCRLTRIFLGNRAILSSSDMPKYLSLGS